MLCGCVHSPCGASVSRSAAARHWPNLTDYRRRRLVFIGLAAAGSGIRRALLKHLPGAEPLTFDCLVAEDPMSLYRNCLFRYVEAHGGALPEWNRQAMDAGSSSKACRSSTT